MLRYFAIRLLSSDKEHEGLRRNESSIEAVQLVLSIVLKE